jgi:hypothetical protein
LHKAENRVKNAVEVSPRSKRGETSIFKNIVWTIVDELQDLRLPVKIAN